MTDNEHGNAGFAMALGNLFDNTGNHDKKNITSNNKRTSKWIFKKLVKHMKANQSQRLISFGLAEL